MPQEKLRAKSAQEFLPIQEIRDGIVVLKNGSLRLVLMASSLNFSLKSTQEQDAIILQYQNFLNSLDFTVQFFIQSRKLNISPYIEILSEAEKKQSNELIKIQTREYIEFVKTFVETSNIVTKTFYVVVPFEPPAFEVAKGLISSLFKPLAQRKGGGSQRTSDEKFEEHKTQLWQRVDAATQGLIRCGVRVAPLNTEELIELYYGLFNPGELEKGGAPEIAS